MLWHRVMAGSPNGFLLAYKIPVLSFRESSVLLHPRGEAHLDEGKSGHVALFRSLRHEETSPMGL